ncbi:GGDEF domain-containing protein [Poseidonibacter lekithochrous]|uniref:GGDEF domain-containing protein n=1 Tax=Poseidonibacter lekithochrous TaxID=1904463 RepID=UPI0008FC9F38|nr:GGDEF domain-containing protein [Poseidonibacter lekithochrous]QKJ21552.1 diguanylate cyclase/phosphodiesterase [Poseidonibacter lekithochrous]
MTKKWTKILEKLDYAFQPIIHSHSGKIFAVEALIRNVHKTDYLSNIQSLFDLAFEEDILYEVDLLLREMAIKKFAGIKIENLRLFYNLDNRIIYNKNYSEGNTSKILQKYNLPKSSICFELSEKGTTIEQNALSTMIQNYKKSGYQIAIDDFGIGVSGLKLLYFSEAHIIKLDRFFISNIDSDSKKKLFCSSIVEMAHTMGMKVIAEGVENTNEFYTCKEIGVDFIQGFLVQKPTQDISELKSIYKNIAKIIHSNQRTELTTMIDEEYIQNIEPLEVNSSLHDLFVHFKENTKNTFVPIVDEHKTLLGVIYEVDIKKISYSQYGLSLAKNDNISSSLKKYIKKVLSVESSWGIDKTLNRFNHNQKQTAGIFITNAEKYKGFIDLSSLLILSHKRNIEIASNQNPLTKLPGNQQIEKFIHESIKNKKRDESFMLYFDFNDFKPFNDYYGFRQGDRAILIFSELIQKKYSSDNFIAHIGGDDFFIGIKNCSFEEVFELTNNVLEEFRDTAKNLYNNDDKKNGYIITKDRFEVKRKFNLLSTSCAIIGVNSKSQIANFDHTLNLLKKHSKKYPFPLSATI